MLTSIIFLILVAYITYLIELPIITYNLYKKIDFKYLNKIVFITNIFTNIILNGIIIPIFQIYFYNIVFIIIIMFFEILIIIVEYKMYIIAFKNSIKVNHIKYVLLKSTIIANISSALLGIVLFQSIIK